MTVSGLLSVVVAGVVVAASIFNIKKIRLSTDELLIECASNYLTIVIAIREMELGTFSGLQ